MEVLSGLNLLFTILVLRIHHHRPEQPVSPWIRRLCRLTDERKVLDSSKIEQDRNPNPWHDVAKFCDKVLFIIGMIFVIVATIVLFIIILI